MRLLKLHALNWEETKKLSHEAVLLSKLGRVAPLDSGPPQISAVNLRLRAPRCFGRVRPCVSGCPPVAGARHDWSGIPPDWNGDAGGPRFPTRRAGVTEPVRVPYSPEIQHETMSTAVVKPEIIAQYKTHEKDTGSSEVQIALLTARINHLTEHLRTHRKDFHSRRGLLQMASRRRKLLDYLKRTDLPKYNEMLQKLNLRK